jgi:proteasome lid subunit RPN8/RPN11
VDNEEIKLSDLEATKRDHKVEITDIAISKIPYIKYREIPEDQYETLQSLAKAVLKISRDENDCNEVAIAYDLDGPQKELDGEEYLAWAKGDEYSVEPMSDTETNHVIVSAKGCVVVILHNHPNLSKISLEDVMFMLRLPTIKMVVAVTNRGAIGYIVKTEDYEKNRLAAYKLMEEAVERNNRAVDFKQKQDACDYFLHNCYKVGLIYEDH